MLSQLKMSAELIEIVGLTYENRKRVITGTIKFYMNDEMAYNVRYDCNSRRERHILEFEHSCLKTRKRNKLKHYYIIVPDIV